MRIDAGTLFSMGCSLLPPAATGGRRQQPLSRAAPHPNFQQFQDFTDTAGLAALGGRYRNKTLKAGRVGPDD